MSKPLPDKAEVALDYPDKLYIGTFERAARFDAHLDNVGIALSLERRGPDKKSVHMHFNYGLFAAILHDLATTVRQMPADDLDHRAELSAAALSLARALQPKEVLR